MRIIIETNDHSKPEVQAISESETTVTGNAGAAPVFESESLAGELYTDTDIKSDNDTDAGGPSRELVEAIGEAGENSVTDTDTDAYKDKNADTNTDAGAAPNF